MRELNLLDVTYPHIPNRYFIDGVRVTYDHYEYVKQIALRIDCFTTEGIVLANGKVKRFNRCVATV